MSNLASRVPVVVCVHNSKELLLELQLHRPDKDGNIGHFGGNFDNGTMTMLMLMKTDMYPALQLRVAWVLFRAMDGGGASGESPVDDR